MNNQTFFKSYLSQAHDKKFTPNKNNDPIKVTNAINKALDRSTHMICVISYKTKESWWVPYEIGYVSNNSSFSTRDIGVLVIKDITDLPDYLFLAKKIVTVDDLDNFIKRVSNTTTLLIEYTKNFAEFGNHPMKSILR